MIKKINLKPLLSDYAIAGYFVIINVIIQLLIPEYGYFRDELYYITISEKFSIYNLDMLPLTPLYLKLITFFLGNSLNAIHFASSLSCGLSIFFACLITKELGGKKYALILTGIFLLFSGFLIFSSIFTYDSLDSLIWVIVIYLLVRLFKENEPRLWLLVGVFLGLGLLNKLTILFFGLAIFFCLWFVPQRSFFKNKWIWIAACIAITFSIPFLIWQYQQSWYFIDFAANYAGGISYIASFPEFIWNQLLPNNLFSFPVWLTGLILLLFSTKWKQFRFFGFCYLFLFFLFYLIGAKFYFLIPLYTILISVGSIKISDYIDNFDAKKAKVFKFSLPIIYVILSMPLLPMVVPVLPVEEFVGYADVLGVDAGVKFENNRLKQLPQYYADRFGWEEMVAEIAAVYQKIPENERNEFGIITENWGEAGAVYFYHNKYGLPEPISADGWFYFETLRTNYFKHKYISIGIPLEKLKYLFKDVRQEGLFTHPYCMPYEDNRPVYICKEPKFDPKEYWLVEQRIDPHFRRIMRDAGVPTAIEYFYEARKKDSSTILFTERQINVLGYQYLYDGKTPDAISLFKLNVEVFPEAFNVYDSLGEGYMENGQYELAIYNYKKSLDLNPKNSNAAKMLKKLQDM
jgi:tetratricopeptide (TPR) repeat protein